MLSDFPLKFDVENMVYEPVYYSIRNGFLTNNVVPTLNRYLFSENGRIKNSMYEERY